MASGCIRRARSTSCDGDSVGDAQMLVHHRMNKHGMCPGQNDGGQYRLVHVSRHDDFVAGLTDGKNHRHDRSAGALDGKEGVIRPEGLRRELCAS